MRLILFITIIIICSCKKSVITDREITAILANGTDSTFRTAIDSDNRLHMTLTNFGGMVYKTIVYYNYYEKEKARSIEGYLNDRFYGHWFEFYPNRNLKKYCFFTGDQNGGSRFTTEFTEEGKINNQLGTPLVDFYENVDDNTLNILFSTVLYDSIQVLYSKDKINYKRLKLNKSNMQPMLYVGVLPFDKVFIFRIDAFKDKKRYIFKDIINPH